jgi:hypothetical protein
MKIAKFLLAALVCITFGTAQAQVTVKTTTTSMPDWGVAGNDKATYYYIPDIESYYDVRAGNYVYMDNGKWAKTTTLPTAYKDYDLYNGYKVVLTDEQEPYADYDNIRVKYAKGFKGEPQKTYKVKKNRSGKVKIKEK